MAKFNAEFEKMLSASPDGRPQTINNTTLRELFANRSIEETKTMSQSKINAANKFFETSGMLDMTPAELTSNPVAFAQMMQGEGYQKLGKSQATKAQAFLSGILEDAGHGQSWPSRTLKTQLGREKALETFDFEVTRAKVKEFPDDVFSKLKQSVIRLQNAGDTGAASQLIMHMFGGYRPEDLNGINVEDINFKTGVVENIEIKGAGETVMKTAVFPPPILDAIKMHVGDRKTGLLFENTQANSERINKVFDGVFGPDYLTVTSPKKGKRTEPMRVKKLRNLNESILSGYDVSDTARKVITLRATSNVAEDYATSASRRRQLEKITARNVALFSAASETPSVAQFMNDVGVTSPSRRTATIAATQEVLEEIGYENAVSPEFYSSLPESGEVVGGKVAGQIDPELSAALSQEQQQAAQMRAEDIEITRGQRAEELLSARQATAQTSAESKAQQKAESLETTKSKLLGNIAKAGRPILKMLPPVAFAAGAEKGYEYFAGAPAPLRVLGATAAGAAEVMAPPGMGPTDVEFREQQRTTLPAGSGLGPRTDAPPSLSGMGYISPEAAQYPMEAAPANIPEPVSTDQGQLEAEGFAEQRNQARTAAMQGQETTMAESFLYGGIVR